MHTWRHTLHGIPWRATLAAGLFAVCPALFGLEVPISGNTLRDRPSADFPDLPQYLSPEPSPGLTLPAVPSPRLAPQAVGPSFELKGVVFEGNTAFSTEELTSIAAPFIGKRVDIADLETLRYGLTKHYTDRGYFNSGALIKPGQRIEGGIVTFEIHEGRLDDIRVTGQERLRNNYIIPRVWPDPNQPFNTEVLKEQFGLLLRDPLIKQLNGRLTPGVEPGSAVLDLAVTRAEPYHLSLTADNRGVPSTGGEQARIDGVVHNLTGFGDALALSIEASEGTTDWDGTFSLPISPADTRIELRYANTHSSLVEQPLADIGIESDYEDLEVSLSHPLYRRLTGHLLLGATLAARKNQNFLDGEPFPFSLGEDAQGRSAVTALRLWQDFQHSTTDWVLAGRSTLSIGLDLFDSTIHAGNLPDSQFVAWLGQIQFAQRVFKDGQVVLRGACQLSNDQLLPLERFALGGMDTVRGYRENTLVRDQAYQMSAELHYPLWRNDTIGHIDLVPFMDYGRAWNHDAWEKGEELWSTGLGLTWAWRERIDAALFVGYDINSAPHAAEYDLQDSGVHFRININLL